MGKGKKKVSAKEHKLILKHARELSVIGVVQNRVFNSPIFVEVKVDFFPSRRVPVLNVS